MSTKTSRPRRSGNPAVRAAAADPRRAAAESRDDAAPQSSQAPPPQAPQAAAPARATASVSVGRRLAYAAAATAAGAAHVLATVYLLGPDLFLTSVLMLAAITAIFVPQARWSGWHRWFAVLVTPVLVHAEFLVPVLTALEAYTLYRTWAIEGTPRVPALLRSQRVQD